MQINIDKLSNVLRELDVTAKSGNPGAGAIAENIAEMSSSFVETSEQLNKLINEYRPSMDPEVLHDWARDIVGQLRKEAGLDSESGVDFEP